MKRRMMTTVLWGIVASLATVAFGADQMNADRPITVASYYFGNDHPGDPRNEKTQGKGGSQWARVEAAHPSFPGHHQPNVPAWGHTDESDPQVLARNIDWEKTDNLFNVPCFPHVTRGWDSSPRARQSDEYGNYGYPFMHTTSANTPEQFREVFGAVKQWS